MSTPPKAEPPTIPLVRPQRPVLSPLQKLLRYCRRFWSDIRAQMSSNPLDRCRVGSDGTFRHSVSDNSKDQLGRAGEEEAVFFLEERGFRVIAKNFRIENTEIDIVAQDGRTLVIAEVKTRRTGDFGAPSEAIKRPKMQRLVRAADLFAKRRRLRGVPIRFDIIDIVWPENEPPRIKHIADAFQVNDLFR